MVKDNQPDWDSLAEKFDLWLPLFKPIADALIERLSPAPGDKVLDVACGTGEPAFTLAERHPHVQVTGVDAAPGMVRAASNKLKHKHLSNLEFNSMPAEKLEFHDEQFDKLICRFGVMLFEDSRRGLEEMRRVLKPDGRFSLAVWSSPETMTSLYWSHLVFKDKIPEADAPPLNKATSLGAPGVLEDLLTEVGFSHFEVEKCNIDYRFSSFKEYWDLVEASDIMKQQFDALSAEQYPIVKNEFSSLAAQFHSEDGLIIPHEFLIASGVK